MCGCGRKNQTRRVSRPSSSSFAVNNRLNRNLLNQSDQVINSSNNNTITNDRKIIERKRREEILKKLGRL